MSASKPTSQSVNEPTSQSLSQSTSQPISQSVRQSVNTSINQTTSQSVSQSVNQSASQSPNQPSIPLVSVSGPAAHQVPGADDGLAHVVGMEGEEEGLVVGAVADGQGGGGIAQPRHVAAVRQQDLVPLACHRGVLRLEPAHSHTYATAVRHVIVAGNVIAVRHVTVVRHVIAVT